MPRAYPIHSMTGYARASALTPMGELQLELRSVNHRYLDMSLRVPEELRALEGQLRNRLRERLGRGKLEAFLRLRPHPDSAAGLTLNARVLQGVAEACNQVQAALPEATSLDPLNVLRWPGVMQEPELDLEQMKAALQDLTDEALDQLCTMRADEGERMGQVLEDKLAGVETLLEKVQQRLPEQGRLLRDKLQQRMDEVSELDQERKDQALVQFIQRLDVDEEIKRLGSHCAATRDGLKETDPVGRKLDFLMQEFNREANTLGSKSMDAELTGYAVELKVLIEQMREQVQNIE